MSASDFGRTDALAGDDAVLQRVPRGHWQCRRRQVHEGVFASNTSDAEGCDASVYSFGQSEEFRL
jgi:hypothetical protein